MIFFPINYACLWAEVVTPAELSHPQQALFVSAPPGHISVMNLPLPWLYPNERQQKLNGILLLKRNLDHSQWRHIECLPL